MSNITTLFFFKSNYCENNLFWKYCVNISQLRFFIFYIIFSFFQFILIHTFSFLFFFFLFIFLLHTCIPLLSSIYLLFLFLVHSGSFLQLSLSLSLALFFNFLFLLDSRTLYLSFSHKQILSHTHRSLAEKWRSVFYMFVCLFFFFWFD